MLKRMKPRRHISLAAAVSLFLLLLPVHTGASQPSELGPSSPAVETKSKKVAIVIDDFGNNMEGTAEMLDLPIPFTVAVMPFLPSTKQDAQLAHDKGHEVILHLPMEPVRGKKSWLGPGALTTDLSSDEIRKRIVAAVEDVPYAIGINNHMGSKVTADERIMNILVDICKERNLILLDSRTSPKSLIGKLASRKGVPFSENQLFFDDLYTYSHISKQMVRFKKLVHDRDLVIAIGHVGPPGKKTASVIKEAIPSIQKEASFVPLSQTVSLGGKTF
ncbi:divergent polysaccharide deacetylase family protein [Paenibacillus sp. MAHUQ-63]|nr:divergent polysaccharide deacetylase family protein [Paenibacillus sp. MAHUQ-63]MDD9269896.1 divergent polysaccharide deacetylase family protein [Paenibacillus sp. MAHUQ-63]